MAARAKKLLTNLELEVMRAVWGRPEGTTVREITEQVNAGRTRELAYNTVQTMLGILRDKGVVQARKGPGRAFTWTARVSESDVRGSMVGDLVDRLFDGQVRPLLLCLVERERVSPEELRDLRALIDDKLSDGHDGEERA